MKNHYKQGAYVLALLGLLCLGSCSKSYDDSALKESIGKIEQRAGSLDALITRANTNIQALQAMAQSMAGQDYLESYSQDNAGNLILKFAKAGNITISQGTKGEDGVAPSMSIAKAEDGKYYWQVAGTWILNSQGKKVSAVPANGITPRLKIEGGMWYISYDEGRSWEPRSLGKAIGETGPEGRSGSSNGSLVQSVTWTKYHGAKFVLNTGEELLVPRGLSDAAIEVLGEVPELIFYGKLPIFEQPLKLRVSYTTDYHLQINVDGRGSVDIRDIQSTTKHIDERRREREITVQLSSTSLLPTAEGDDVSVGSVVVDIVSKVDEETHYSHLLKTHVIPIKYRKANVYSLNRRVRLDPRGETRSIPLLMGDAPYDIVYSIGTGSEYFKFEKRDDVLVVTVPQNTTNNIYTTAVGIQYKDLLFGKSIQVIRFTQVPLTMGSPSYELTLGSGETIAAQMTRQGYTEGSNIGLLKVKGTATMEDFASFKSFFGGMHSRGIYPIVESIDFSALPIVSLSSEFGEGLSDLHSRYITWPSTLRTIGERALSGRSMYDLRLPEGLKTISWNAFSYFRMYDEVPFIMPHSVTAMRGAAFYSSYIPFVALSNGLTEVAQGAFMDSELVKIILPTNTRFNKIDNDAFFNCTKLNSIYCYQQTPPTLGSRAFTNVSSDAKVYIPVGSKAKYLASAWAKYFRPSAFVEQANAPIAEDIFYTEPKQ